MEDIYDDCPDFDLGSSMIKVEEQNNHLRKHIISLENEIEITNIKLADMKKTQCILENNISELFKTARNEIARKDRIIAELRREKESFALKRQRGDIKRVREEETTSTMPNLSHPAKKPKFQHVNSRYYEGHEQQFPARRGRMEYDHRHRSESYEDWGRGGRQQRYNRTFYSDRYGTRESHSRNEDSHNSGETCSQYLPNKAYPTLNEDNFDQINNINPLPAKVAEKPKESTTEIIKSKNKSKHRIEDVSQKLLAKQEKLEPDINMIEETNAAILTILSDSRTEELEKEIEALDAKRSETEVDSNKLSEVEKENEEHSLKSGNTESSSKIETDSDKWNQNEEYGTKTTPIIDEAKSINIDSNIVDKKQASLSVVIEKMDPTSLNQIPNWSSFISSADPEKQASPKQTEKSKVVDHKPIRKNSVLNLKKSPRKRVGLQFEEALSKPMKHDRKITARHLEIDPKSSDKKKIDDKEPTHSKSEIKKPSNVNLDQKGKVETEKVTILSKNKEPEILAEITKKNDPKSDVSTENCDNKKKAFLGVESERDLNKISEVKKTKLPKHDTNIEKATKKDDTKDKSEKDKKRDQVKKKTKIEESKSINKEDCKQVDKQPKDERKQSSIRSIEIRKDPIKSTKQDKKITVRHLEMHGKSPEKAPKTVKDKKAVPESAEKSEEPVKAKRGRKKKGAPKAAKEEEESERVLRSSSRGNAVAELPMEPEKSTPLIEKLKQRFSSDMDNSTQRSDSINLSLSSVSSNDSLNLLPKPEIPKQVEKESASTVCDKSSVLHDDLSISFDETNVMKSDVKDNNNSDLSAPACPSANKSSTKKKKRNRVILKMLD